MSAAPRYTCCDDLRLAAAAAHPTLNGIDWLEVLDADAPAGSPRQRTLLVRCLKPLAALDADNVAILGGERVRNVGVEWAAPASAVPAALVTAAEQAFLAALPAADRVLVVRTDVAGDFSTYTLRLQRGPDDPRPPLSFDPRLAEVDLAFKVECPDDFDCAPARACDQPEEAGPDVDYLAKDYPSFRRLLLDRLARTLPAWGDRTPADLGVTLVEVLAYAGDQLSYFQDAVATEAYLETARRRASLRRHALLVDYAVHEGSNARAWVQLRLAPGVPSATIALRGLRILTRVPPLPGRIPDDPASRDYRDAFAAAPTVFEPMDPAGALEVGASAAVTLRASHHEIPFYTWGDRRCSLPAGATAATLAGHFDTLAPGDVLIFEEVKGPLTGEPGDADPAHRHAVRLTTVRHTTLDGGPPAPLVDPLPSPAPEITEIAWGDADALPFPLCLSSRTDEAHGHVLVDGVSVARGNIVLADHGASVADEPIGAMPPSRVRLPVPTRECGCAGGCCCDPEPPEPVPARWRPALARGPLTHAGTVERVRTVAGVATRARLRFDPAAPASRATAWRDADVLPAVRLTSQRGSGAATVTTSWLARRDLLGGAADDAHFVAESEGDGRVFLRFGDDAHGRRPEPGERFAASYRVGRGTGGNVGADALAHVVTDDVRIAGARNPLPARGGTEPETAAQIRRRAPQAFRTQERAVTPEDYARVTERFPGVQRAAATQRWTGSWYTTFITVDRAGGAPLDADFREALEAHIEPFRMAGHDVALDDPVRVSLELELLVCVLPGYARSAVRARVLELLGRRGLFHPDRLTFGQPVYLGPIYAAVRGVPGVESVEVVKFGRQGQTHDPRPLLEGVLPLGRLEIARLDDDRNFPEHGVLRLALHGGQ